MDVIPLTYFDVVISQGLLEGTEVQENILKYVIVVKANTSDTAIGSLSWGTNRETAAVQMLKEINLDKQEVTSFMTKTG